MLRAVAGLEQRGLFVRGVEQQEERSQQLGNLRHHLAGQVRVAGDLLEFRLFVEQAGADHDRQQQLADFILGVQEPGIFPQKNAFHEANAPAADVGLVGFFAKVGVARQFDVVIARQLPANMGLELDQRCLDAGALLGVAVGRLFGEQGVDPLTLRHFGGADGQGRQVAVGGHVVEGLFVQVVSVEEGLQTGKLLGE